MKRPIPIARSVTNAFGIDEVYQERLFNMFAEAPVPVNPEGGANEFSYVLRTVPGERNIININDLRRVFIHSDLRITGAHWMEHHSVPFFQGRLLVVTNRGVVMCGSMRRGDKWGVIPNSLKFWPDRITGLQPAQGATSISGDVHIASNGFSWVITTEGGRAFVYRLRELYPGEDDGRQVAVSPEEGGSGAGYAVELTEFKTVRGFRQQKQPERPEMDVEIPEDFRANKPGEALGLTATSLRDWWQRRKEYIYLQDGNRVVLGRKSGELDWPEALAEFGGNLGENASFGPVIFHGGRYIAQEKDSGRFYWSGVAGGFDQHVFLPLNFATAESDGDPLVSLVSNRKIFYPLGTRTAEVWYTNVPGTIQTGQANRVTLPYAHAPASDSDRGCAGAFATAHLAGNAFWLGTDGSVFVASGRDVTRVTAQAQASLFGTRAGDDSPGRPRDLRRARLFGWQEFGHDFLAVRIPEAPTVVFDLTTGQWHERGDESGREWRIKGVLETGRTPRLLGWSADGVYHLQFGYDKFDGGTSTSVSGNEGNSIRREVSLPLVENSREDIVPREVEVLTQLDGGDTGGNDIKLVVNRNRNTNNSTDQEFFAKMNGAEPSVFPGIQGSSKDFSFTLVYEGPGILTIFALYFDFYSNPDFEPARGGR